MKIALITDTHWGIRNDSQIFLEYFEKFYNDIFFPALEARGINTIFHLGDLVDRRKYINYNTLNNMKRIFMARCGIDGYDLHVIVGNHDVPFKNTNNVNSLNELFDKMGIHYYSEPKTVNIDGTDILLMPWINNTNYADSMKAMAETKAHVMFAHLEVAGCLMDRGTVNLHGMKVTDFSRFETVLSGHFHHKSTTNNLTYLGAPYEMTWADYHDPKGFHIYDTTTGELEFILNPYTLFHKIFYSDDNKTLKEILDHDFSRYKHTYVKVVKQTNDNPYWFDKFMDKLYKSEPAHIQIVDDHLNLNLEDNDDIVSEAEDTITILSKYIETLENAPKKELDILMRSLYNEALHMEIS